MRTTKGVVMDGVHRMILYAMYIVDREMYGDFGVPLVVTSVKDGKHKVNSLHYVGRAFDFRVSSMSDDKSERAAWFEDLRRELGGDYDVIDEGHHGHIEWDPSG